MTLENLWYDSLDHKCCDTFRPRTTDKHTIDIFDNRSYCSYRIAGHFGGSKFWRMTVLANLILAPRGWLTYHCNRKSRFWRILFWRMLDDSSNSPKFPPAKITRYTVIDLLLARWPLHTMYLRSNADISPGDEFYTSKDT